MLLPIKRFFKVLFLLNTITVFHGLLTFKCLTYASTLPFGCCFIMKVLFIFGRMAVGVIIDKFLFYHKNL